MPYASLADRTACAARNYASKKKYFAEKHRRWRTTNPKRYAYLGQRNTSKLRGVRFKIRFREWVEWWGNDFAQRGRKMTELCMCRYGDVGAYELGNIYKATNAENKGPPREIDEGLHEFIPF